VERVRAGSRIYVVAVLCLSFCLLTLPAANAYVDPGTGSFVFQAVVGGILAVALAVKMFWRRIVAFVTRRGSSPDEPV
jgi:hypothetical protein